MVLPNKLHAEDIDNYWKSSKISPDTWLEKAKREITRAGGARSEYIIQKANRRCAAKCTTGDYLHSNRLFFWRKAHRRSWCLR